MAAEFSDVTVHVCLLHVHPAILKQS